MIITYATRRNANGYRKFLVVDTARKEYARQGRRAYYTREEFIEISAADRKYIIEECKRESYTERDFL